ncbi:MAG TPA: hypothetical protein VKC17_05645 [Sphingomicrobium sp.]|nr:hypothetical protein [Sphingomicrobium sp.]
MSWAFAAAAVLAVATGSAAADAWSNAPPPLYDPVFLNLGFVCRWEARCMDRQDDAMKRALKYVRTKHPPAWRVQLCNRNAGRKGQRVDWIGFEHCMRNEALRPPPANQGARRRSARPAG